MNSEKSEGKERGYYHGWSKKDLEHELSYLQYLQQEWEMKIREQRINEIKERLKTNNHE
jgi:hypothetical protein